MESGEEKKKRDSSSTDDVVVGAKSSSSDSSSSGIVNAIFPPPTKEPLHFLAAEKKNGHGSQDSKAESSVSAKAEGAESGSQNMPENDKGSIEHPCHYSSSIFYGGQDVLAQPENSHNSTETNFDKGGEEDDPNAASRGNWWQGSLYY